MLNICASDPPAAREQYIIDDGCHEHQLNGRDGWPMEMRATRLTEAPSFVAESCRIRPFDDTIPERCMQAFACLQRVEFLSVATMVAAVGLY